MKKFFLLVNLTVAACLFAQTRAFNDIFPKLDPQIRTQTFSEDGFISYSHKTTGFSLLGGSASGIDPQIINLVLGKDPGYVIESLIVISGDSSRMTILDIYNGLRNIRALKGRLYDSATRGQPTVLFEEATRIAGEKQTSAIADPGIAASLPQNETLYIRLKDINFGNTFYRGEMAVLKNGLRYTLTNFKNMTYLFIPVIKENRFTAQLYIEPVREGVLIYSIAGVDISDFAASRIDVNSAIAKRLSVITSWATDGITGGMKK